MSNGIVEALEKAGQAIEKAVEDAARSVTTFFRDTGGRLRESAQRWRSADDDAKNELDRIRPEDEHPTVHDTGTAVNRDRSLGEDPAHGGDYNSNEHDNAIRTQQKLGVRLERDPTGRREWVDQDGKTYDLMGPVPSQYLSTTRQWNKLISSIHDHAGKADVVPFDLTGLSESQVERIKSEAAASGGHFVWLP